MKIGLLRHFRTGHIFPRRCDSEVYNREYWNYEKSRILPVEPENIPETDYYHICYASPAPRAQETARLCFRFPGEIVTTPDLLEVPLQAFFNTRFRFSMKCWHFLNRVAWGFNSQRIPETRRQTLLRARKLLDEIFPPGQGGEKNVLLVTHGFFMVMLQAELKRRGFKGEEFFRPEHGRVYMFERSDDVAVSEGK